MSHDASPYGPAKAEIMELDGNYRGICTEVRTTFSDPIMGPEVAKRTKNSEDRRLKVPFSLAMIAFDRESAQMSQILSSQGKNAPSNAYPHYLVRLATSRWVRQRSGEGVVRRNGCPKGCFWRVRFFSAPLRFSGVKEQTLRGQRRNGLSRNILLDKRFSARRLLRSFGAL